MPSGDRLLYRVAECAELLGISRSKAYELVAAGTLPSVRLGTAVRVPRAALLDWIARETTTAMEVGNR